MIGTKPVVYSQFENALKKYRRKIELKIGKSHILYIFVFSDDEIMEVRGRRGKWKWLCVVVSC